LRRRYSKRIRTVDAADQDWNDTLAHCLDGSAKLI
jgi:hypothetical protein